MSKPYPYDDVFGDGQIDDVISIDQSPIGRSPRSNPVTYVKAFDDIQSVGMGRQACEALTYQRATQTSLGNTRLMQAISQQFHLPKEAARSEAETLLDSKLVCTLGGRYELVSRNGHSVWPSTRPPASVRHWICWPLMTPRWRTGAALGQIARESTG